MKTHWSDFFFIPYSLLTFTHAGFLFLRVVFLKYWCNQDFVEEFIFFLGFRFHYLSKSFNFILSCSLLRISTSMTTGAGNSVRPKLKSWSSLHHHPICLLKCHILVLQSTLSHYTFISGIWYFSPFENLHLEPLLSFMWMTIVILLTSFSSSTLACTLIFSLARASFLKCIPDHFSNWLKNVTRATCFSLH